MMQNNVQTTALQSKHAQGHIVQLAFHPTTREVHCKMLLLCVSALFIMPEFSTGGFLGHLP